MLFLLFLPFSERKHGFLGLRRGRTTNWRRRGLDLQRGRFWSFICGPWPLRCLFYKRGFIPTQKSINLFSLPFIPHISIPFQIPKRVVLKSNGLLEGDVVETSYDTVRIIVRRRSFLVEDILLQLLHVTSFNPCWKDVTRNRDGQIDGAILSPYSLLQKQHLSSKFHKYQPMAGIPGKEKGLFFRAIDWCKCDQHTIDRNLHVHWWLEQHQKSSSLELPFNVLINLILPQVIPFIIVPDFVWYHHFG